MKAAVWHRVGAVFLVLFLCVSAGCSSRHEKIVLQEGDENPPGEIQDGNLIALHKMSWTIGDEYCIVCHGDMTDDTTLDPAVVGIHSLHKTKINYDCTTCHVSTDLLFQTGAKLRKQVNPETICDKCHGPGGIAKQFYQK